MGEFRAGRRSVITYLGNLNACMCPRTIQHHLLQEVARWQGYVFQTLRSTSNKDAFLNMFDMFLPKFPPIQFKPTAGYDYTTPGSCGYGSLSILILAVEGTKPSDRARYSVHMSPPGKSYEYLGRFSHVFLLCFELGFIHVGNGRCFGHRLGFWEVTSYA